MEGLGLRPEWSVEGIDTNGDKHRNEQENSNDGSQYDSLGTVRLAEELRLWHEVLKRSEQAKENQEDLPERGEEEWHSMDVAVDTDEANDEKDIAGHLLGPHSRGNRSRHSLPRLEDHRDGCDNEVRSHEPKVGL